MGFNQLDGRDVVAGVFVRAADRARLAFGDRGVHALGAAIGARSHAREHAVDAVTIALGVVETLEGDHADALGEHGAVRLVAERGAVAARGQCRRLAKAHVHEDVVHQIGAADDDHVRLPQVQLAGTHVQGAERTGAGRVGDAVGAVQVETVCDAAGNDVAQHAREGAFLPLDVVVGNALAGLLHLFFGQAHVAQRLLPDRLLQAADHAPEQLLRRSDAQDDTDSLAVHVLELAVSGVLKHPLGDHEGQKLVGVGGRNDVRGNTPSHRVEVDVWNEGTAVGVGLVPRLGVFVVVVLGQPVRLGHVGDEVFAVKDVAPESGLVERTGKQGADTNNGERDDWTIGHEKASGLS